MRRTLVVTSMLLAVGGCGVYGQYWSRPGSTEAQFEVAATNCDSAALARFPPVTFGMPGYFRTHNEYCTMTAGGPNCQIIGAGYLPQAQPAVDTNEAPRENAFEQCMLAGGWRPSDPSALGPAFSAPEAAITEALTYCESIVKGKPRTSPATGKFNQCVTTRVRELSGPRPPA